MKHNRAAGTIGKLFLAFSILFGIGIWTSTTAQAQWQDDRYERRNEREYRREQRRREREMRREQRRQSRDYGYDNGNGYGYGYGRDRDGYGNYGGSFDLRQTALNAGFADGVKEGRKDRERRERHDYRDEDKYREADRDYSSSKGDKYTYQRYYREAFANGYDDGYNGY